MKILLGWNAKHAWEYFGTAPGHDMFAVFTMSEHMFTRIGIITNSAIMAVRDTLAGLLEYFSSRDNVIILDRCCAGLCQADNYRVIEKEKLGKACDLMIAIGGDGTMLMASHLLRDDDIPLLGINTGHVGFLSDIPADDVASDLDAILRGDFVEDVRFLLRGQVFRGNDCILEDHALNDVIIHKWNIARLVELDTYINSAFVHRHRSDGLIVSTPTGSTAYALSGGGPIVDPSLDALVLVPICPHSLTNRPIVVGGCSRVEIVVGTREVDHARLTCDGEIKLELAPGDRIRVEKKDKKIRLIHPPGHDQFHILREKLHWSK